MFKPPTVEEVDSELAELESRLSEYERLISRKQTLIEYKSVLARLSSNGSESSQQESRGPSKGKAIETADAARKILSSVAQMSEGDLVREAVRLGWNASGSTKKDARRFYAAMHRQDQLFEKVPGMAATWRLKK